MTLLTVEQVCERTHLKERTIRDWMAKGKLPFVRLGAGKGAPVRIRLRDLLALITPGSAGAPAASA